MMRCHQKSIRMYKCFQKTSPSILAGVDIAASGLFPQSKMLRLITKEDFVILNGMAASFLIALFMLAMQGRLGNYSGKPSSKESITVLIV